MAKFLASILDPVLPSVHQEATGQWWTLMGSFPYTIAYSRNGRPSSTCTIGGEILPRLVRPSVEAQLCYNSPLLSDKRGAEMSPFTFAPSPLGAARTPE